ncbi:MAG TPA: hypothetical protein VI423_11975 [Paenisporosarcina sp.]|nr:hypothetical protein [Paenisporosarcina sp.]
MTAEKASGHGWINLGNQFILLYLLERDFPIIGAKHFSIAHAFECYFKSCITNKYDEEKAVNYGHQIFNMFSELKKDPTFLPNLTIEQSVYDLYTIDNQINKLHRDKRLKCDAVSHLLFLFKYCADLKYHRFHKKHKLKDTIAWCYCYPDDRFAEIFFQIRTYLCYDGTSETDSLKNTLEKDLLDRRDDFYGSKIAFLKICIAGKAK